MKQKASELIGIALDWAVAMCEGVEVMKSGAGSTAKMVYVPKGKRSYYAYRPSSNWAQGGPIIEQKRLCINIDSAGVWLSYSKQNYADERRYMHSGPTALIAAMRCYVASKLGDEVDAPNQFCTPTQERTT